VSLSISSRLSRRLPASLSVILSRHILDKAAISMHDIKIAIGGLCGVCMQTLQSNALMDTLF